MMKLIAVSTENPFKKGKEKGIAAVGLKMAIVDPGSRPPTSADYVRQEDETTTDFEMLFTAAQAGKVVYIIAFYLNSRNQAGPDSIPYIITII